MKLNEMSNDQLIEEFLSIKGSYEIDRMNNLIDELENRANRDQQLDDILTILKIWEMDNLPGYLDGKGISFKSLCEDAAPILERLFNKTDWDLFDFALLNRTIQYIKDYEQTEEILKNVLEKLEKYSDHKKYIGIKLGLHMNTLPRFMRAKYFDLEKMKSIYSFRTNPEKLENAKKRIEELFAKNSDIAIDICQQHNFPIFKALVNTRKGIFYNDDKLIGQGIAVLEEAGKDELIKILQDEMDECGIYPSLNTVTKAQLNKMIENTIKELIKTRNITSEEFAKAAQLYKETMKMLELGTKTLSLEDIDELLKVFKISREEFLDMVFYDDEFDGWE